MSEEERRRCCILGGCGCTPGGAEQKEALAAYLEDKADARVTEGIDWLALADAVLEIFGTGPHEKQLAALADG